MLELLLLAYLTFRWIFPFQEKGYLCNLGAFFNYWTPAESTIPLMSEYNSHQSFCFFPIYRSIWKQIGETTGYKEEKHKWRRELIEALRFQSWLMGNTLTSGMKIFFIFYFICSCLRKQMNYDRLKITNWEKKKEIVSEKKIKWEKKRKIWKLLRIILSYGDMCFLWGADYIIGFRRILMVCWETKSKIVKIEN